MQIFLYYIYIKIMKSRSFTISSSQNALESKATQFIYFRLCFEPRKVLFLIFLPVSGVWGGVFGGFFVCFVGWFLGGFFGYFLLLFFLFLFLSPSFQCKQKFKVKFSPKCQAYFNCWISLGRLTWFFWLICESSGVLPWDICLQKRMERGERTSEIHLYTKD